MYKQKLPNFFSQQITNQGRLTKQDLKQLGINPEDVKKKESKQKAKKSKVKEAKEPKEKTDD